MQQPQAAVMASSSYSGRDSGRGRGRVVVVTTGRRVPGSLAARGPEVAAVAVAAAKKGAVAPCGGSVDDLHTSAAAGCVQGRGDAWTCVGSKAKDPHRPPKPPALAERCGAAGGWQSGMFPPPGQPPARRPRPSSPSLPETTLRSSHLS